jgi:hypothetical protein
MHKDVQASRGQANQQSELVKQLQDKVRLTENMVIDITIFKAQALEVGKKLESTQQSLFNKVKSIQNHFQR